MYLKYFSPFKAAQNQDLATALQNKILNIEGEAIDTSVNANKWQVPEEDLDYVLETLRGAQLRADHAESIYMVIGRVPEATRSGQQVFFKAEIGDERLFDKILRGYVNHVSIQIDSDEIECSKCKKPTRKDGMMIHLCLGGWEIVHKPRVRELSIVASSAYEDTFFKPTGFSAAMNDNQMQTARHTCETCTICRARDKVTCPTKILDLNEKSKLPESNKDVGSKGNLQEPENKTIQPKEEVKLLSEQNAQANASPLQAQSVINTAPGETAPKQTTYEGYMNQLAQLENKIKESPTASEAEIEALSKKVGELEAEIDKRASKKMLSKKIAELSKKLSDEDGIIAENETVTTASKTATGKGIVATDEINKDTLGNAEWFRDLLKAHSKLVGLK